MARKVIDYQEWERTRPLVEARARRILAYFDMERLKRKPREAAKEAWLRAHKQTSRFPNASARPPREQ